MKWLDETPTVPVVGWEWRTGVAAARSLTAPSGTIGTRRAPLRRSFLRCRANVRPHPESLIAVQRLIASAICYRQASWPALKRTLKRLADARIPVMAVDVSELQKAEGAVTCCSLLFRESIAR